MTRAPRRRARKSRPRVRHGRKRAAVFVDRDGTLNREVEYLANVAGLRLLPGAAAGVRALRAAGFAVVVVSNQSGVARGFMTLETVHAINREMARRLAVHGAVIDGIYVCPHHPSAGVPPLRRRCRCRKPAPGLVRQAVRDLDLDVARSYCVGDGAGDVRMGAALGVPGVLVLTGHGRRTARDSELPRAHVAANFRAAAKWIIDDAQPSARRRRR